MAGKIFINYRRGDDPGSAQALFARLEQVFPREQLFMDVDNIDPGLDFVQVLKDQVAECDVLISVIGKGWLEAHDGDGARRLDDPGDFVRIEIESALKQNKLVIPVLVGQAQMPRTHELPDAIKPLATRNAVRLTHERFRSDVQGLVTALQRGLRNIEDARTGAAARLDEEAKADRRAQEDREAEAKRRADEEERDKQTRPEARRHEEMEHRTGQAKPSQRSDQEQVLAAAERVQNDVPGKPPNKFALLTVAASVTAAETAPALPDKPSIAVLPFQNMSGDPEQDYFADGMVEDIIMALSRMRWLFVIARNSTFTYKGRAVDVKQIGRELGVRYVLEGSVRKSANRVRLTGQLIDAANGAHLWADRFEGSLEDIFDLQDRVTTSVVSAIAPKLEQAEIERAKRKPTESLDAYDYFLRGMENTHTHRQTRESVSETLRLFHKAIELDSNFAAAYGMAAFCYVWRKASGWVSDRAQEIAEASSLARRAVELGKDDAVALSRAGYALAYVVEDLEAGALFIDRALVLNPNLASACFSSAWLRVWIGEPEIAIQHLARFMRVSPLDPLLPWVCSAAAFAHVFAGRYDEAVRFAEQALNEQPNSHQALRSAALSCALAGRLEQARKAMSRLREIDPRLCISNLKNVMPLQRSQDMAKLAEGLRMAGLPE
jgi:TolB-like protein